MSRHPALGGAPPQTVSPRPYADGVTTSQPTLPLDMRAPTAKFSTQLLKWIGNKQKMAHQIADMLPPVDDVTYFEPFLGSAAVLGTLEPPRAIGSDAYGPLMGIWQQLHDDPEVLMDWYSSRRQLWWDAGTPEARREVYETILAHFNVAPNAADFVFLARSCYGGVVRFRQADGGMSTPMGAHTPVDEASFRKRALIWAERTKGAKFEHMDYREAFALAGPGDVLYCDPPYVHTQTILYGGQSFRLADLFTEIAKAKVRGVRVALSIDGTKRSGELLCDIPLPEGVFETEAMVTVGRSMLRRFQLGGSTLEGEVVADRLLLTYIPG